MMYVGMKRYGFGYLLSPLSGATVVLPSGQVTATAQAHCS
jgi:hypothetical protein